MTAVDTTKRLLVCRVIFASPLDAGVGTTFRELRTIVPGGADTVVIPAPDQPPIYELRYRPRPLIRRQGLDLVLHMVGYEDRPTGQTFERLLDGTDALVMILDSNPAAMDANRVAMQDVEAAFNTRGIDLGDLVVILQYNKRDLPDALPIRTLESALNAGNWPYVATSSHRAQGLQQLVDRVTAEVARRARPPRSWAPSQGHQLRSGSFPVPEGEIPADEEKTQLFGTRPRVSDALQRADQRLFGRRHPSGPWPDPDEDSTVIADEQPAPGSEITVAPVAEAETTATTPDEPAPPPPVEPPPPPPVEPVAVEPAAPAESAAVAELRRHAGPRQGGAIAGPDSAPWDGNTPPPATSPPPAPAPVPTPAPELVHVRVPVLGRHQPTALGRPTMRGTRAIDLPFTATVDGQRQDVVLRVELGAAGAPPNVPPVSPAAGGAKGETPRMVPLSWLIFTAGLLLVVVIALVLGSFG